MSKSVIALPDDKRLAVPLSHGIRKGNILQVAGQVSLDPATGEIVGTTVAEQTVQCFTNIQAILEAGGASFDDVMMVRVYLTDPTHFAELNGAYAAFLAEPYPARTTVYVGLPPGFLVEIDALAVLDQ